MTHQPSLRKKHLSYYCSFKHNPSALLLLVSQKFSPPSSIHPGLPQQPPTHTCKSRSHGVRFIITGLKAASWTRAASRVQARAGQESGGTGASPPPLPSCLLCRRISNGFCVPSPEWMLCLLMVLLGEEDTTVCFSIFCILVPGDDRKIITHPMFMEQLLHWHFQQDVDRCQVWPQKKGYIFKEACLLSSCVRIKCPFLYLSGLLLLWPYDLDFPGQFCFDMYFPIFKNRNPRIQSVSLVTPSVRFNRKSWSFLTVFSALDGMSNFPLDSKERQGSARVGAGQGSGGRLLDKADGGKEIGWNRRVVAHWLIWLRIRGYLSCVLAIPLPHSHFKCEPVHSVPEESPRIPG